MTLKKLSKVSLFSIIPLFLAIEGYPQSKNGFDLSNSTIPTKEIMGGGPPRDGIPSIDNPRFTSVEEADGWLNDEDLVVAFSHNGVRRAYPLRILVYHEIVNDSVGGKPIAVTYCPLCGTSMVFDAIVDGRHLDFGVSGLLWNSDVLMYDRETESLWSQLAMKAVSGPQAGKELELLPADHLKWGAWKKENPMGEVLSRKTGHNRNYNRTPYAGYESMDRTMFPVRKYRDDLRNKAWVAGVHLGDASVAFPLDELPDREWTKVKIKDHEVQVHYNRETEEIAAKTIDTGETLPVIKAYWFAWQAFYPQTALWRSE